MDPKSQRKIHNLESIERFPADQLLDYLPIKKQDNVLDLGAGTGYVSLAAADRVNSVYAFDYDKEILAYLEATAHAKGLENIKTISGNFKNIPLETDFFDIAIASIALHEVDPLSSALTEIHRVLKDKGLFLCLELEKDEHAGGPRVSFKDMQAAMIDAGFSIANTFFPTTKIANQPIYIILAEKNK